MKDPGPESIPALRRRLFEAGFPHDLATALRVRSAARQGRLVWGPGEITIIGENFETIRKEAPSSVLEEA
jgi:hypothetical protein